MVKFADLHCIRLMYVFAVEIQEKFARNIYNTLYKRSLKKMINMTTKHIKF